MPPTGTPPRAFSVARCHRSAPVTLLALAILHCSAGGAVGLDDRPFSKRAGPRGPTMFSPVAAADSGMVTENNYADPVVTGSESTDPRARGRRYQEFSVGAVGTGVAIGDYDGDGRPDVFVVSKTESCRLFRNLGDWKFEDVTTRAGVGDVGEQAAVWKQGAAFADVNNDGWLDLYICRFAAPNLLYMNQGDGTFREEAAARGLAVSDASVMGAFCDYDRDGWLDVYVQTNLLDASTAPRGQRDHLFRNNGDGTFTDVSERAGIRGETQGHSAVWWDSDEDGWPDLYVANDFAAPDTLYRNNRDGTFTNIINDAVPMIPYSSMGADFADVDGDGRMDLLVADMAATNHQKDQRTIAASRAQTQSPPDDSIEAPQFPRNALYLNTGTGRFLEAAFLAGLHATDWTWSVRFEDLDLDGRVDLHVTNGMHREVHNVDLLQRLAAAQSVEERERIERSSPVLVEQNLAYRNRGDLVFEDVSASWGLDEKGVSFGAAFGDLDGDGDLDLVYTNYREGVTLVRNDVETGHAAIVALRGVRSNRFGIGATVRVTSNQGTQVRQLSLGRGLLSTSEPVVHFGLGEATGIEELDVHWPSGVRQTFSGLAVDKRFVITEPEGGEQLVATREASDERWFEEASETFGLSLRVPERPSDEFGQNPLLPVRQNRRGPALAVGDVDRDGRDDVAIGGTPLQPARVLRAGGAGGFANVSSLNANPALADGPLLLFDADGDGDADLLTTRSGVDRPPGTAEYQPQLWWNDGSGKFGLANAGVLPALSISVGAAVAADFDRDGKLDLFLGARTLPGLYPLSPRSALLLNRGGRFEDVTRRLAPGFSEAGMVSAALATDVDDDSRPDLLLAVEWGPVRYFRNREDGRFEELTEAAGFAAGGTGWWSSLAAGDFNGDGHLDYVAGNVGLNTQYRASAERPALLFFGDFANGGAPQIVEAYHEEDRIYPWRTRRQLGARIPPIMRRFPRNDLYARATLEEIVGAEPLGRARRFAATELRSGVFLSQPNGIRCFASLPRLAQIAPAQGIVTGDFDGDGHPDLFMAQNSYAPSPVTGRFDGGLGLLLRGDGQGGFAVVPPRTSGLVVPGDAKAAVAIDLDDDARPELLVTRNNASSLAFQNRSGGGAPLRVDLRGLAGNPRAIGARVTLNRANGDRQAMEVHAGSGYFSQSSTACFFGGAAENPPRSITVRWPDGSTSEQVVAPGSATMTIVFGEH